MVLGSMGRCGQCMTKLDARTKIMLMRMHTVVQVKMRWTTVVLTMPKGMLSSMMGMNSDTRLARETKKRKRSRRSRDRPERIALKTLVGGVMCRMSSAWTFLRLRTL